MSIVIDTSTTLRGTSDLRRLVEAIVAASEHDEADWVEWKSVLDLTTKDGCFHVARAVLGMANRSWERAQLACEGLGYVVVGAEPGSVIGVSTIDPASLDQSLEPYLGGAAGPRFTPTYVPTSAGTVLIVTVEAPKAGDPLFTLRKESGKYRSGTVFVRKSGRTVIADASDMDALQRRLTAAVPSRPDLEVAVVGDVPLSWFDGTTVGDDIERWAIERTTRQIAEAEAEEQRRLAPEPTVTDATGFPGIFAGQEQLRRQMAQISAQFDWVRGEEDTRTLDEYVEQVKDWQGRLRDAAIQGFPSRYVEAGHGVVELEVRNPSGRYLPDVEIEVHFGFEPSTGLDSTPERVDLPPPPRKYGERTLARGVGSLLDTRYQVPFMPSALDGVARRTWVDDGSIRVRFDIGDLRQHAKDVSDEVYVLLAARPEDGVLHGTWRATVRDVEGVLTGTVDVPVAERPVDPIEVVKAKLSRGPE